MPKRITPAPALTAEELEAMLETAISRADVPLTVTAAIKALPVGKKPNKEQVQICLAKLVAAARIHQWPSKKFWSVNPESFAREQMLRTLSAGPLTGAAHAARRRRETAPRPHHAETANQ